MGGGDDGKHKINEDRNGDDAFSSEPKNGAT